jgi:hypothetical protein
LAARLGRDVVRVYLGGEETDAAWPAGPLTAKALVRFGRFSQWAKTCQPS